MMLNIFTQVCGLAVIILLIYLCTRHRIVGLQREYLFIQILGVTALALCVDILSIFAIHYELVFTPPVTAFICRLYIAILTTETMYSTIYTANVVFSGKTYRRVLALLIAINVIHAVLAFTLPIGYYENGLMAYSYGPAVLAAYAVAATFLVMSMMLTFVKSVELTKLHRRAIRAWIISWVVAAVIQFTNPQILLTGFASAFGVLIIFCALENPDSRLDRNTGAYNEGTCVEYIKSCFDQGKAYSMIIVSLEHGKNLALNAMQHDQATQKFADFFLGLGRYRVFCDSEFDFQILIEEKDDLEKVLGRIKERFVAEWMLDGLDEGIIFEPNYVILEDSRIFNDSRDHFTVMQQMMHHFPVTEGDEFRVDKSTVDKITEFGQINQEIKLALEEDRVEPFYQPIYSIKDGTFTAAEGLARIRGKDGNLIPPGIFIPVAEETGLVKKIDERVFEKSCQLLALEKFPEKGMHYIELNVSVSQCEDPLLYKRYIEILDKYKVDPKHINLEVTESACINQKGVLLKNIDRLREHGMKFSLDDFGTGQSNLDYIISMPVDIIKYDMSITRSYFENEKTRIAMRNTANMIDEMGLSIVVEGVETKEQFEELCKLPIDYIQGYYFSKPLPVDEFVKFIEEKNKK